MTSAHELNDLLAICQARYTLRQQDFAKLVAEENRLRTELLRLGRMNRDNATIEVGPADMRAIGADIIWQGWLGRAKTTLNLSLAQVLATKEHHLKEVRQAYGKVLVVEEMKTQMDREHRKSRADKSLSQAIETSLFQGT